MSAHSAHCFDQQGNLKQAQEHHYKARRPRLDDFRVATYHDSVGMVPRMAPAPYMWLEHAHETGHLVQPVIHPPGLERGAVASLVPARVGGCGVKNAVRQEERHTCPGTPEPVAAETADQQRQQPDGSVEQGRAVAALHQLFHALTGDGRLVPIGRYQAFFRCAGSFGAGQAIVALTGCIVLRHCYYSPQV